MSKRILYKDLARKALEQGIDVLAKAVSITLGPKGRNVVIDKKYGTPQIINDGIAIAKEIELKNRIENTGVSLIRQAAAKTNDVAGDGTTTAIVLAHAIIKQGLKYVSTGSNPISLKKGIEKATQFMIQKISENSKPIEDIKSIIQVASISAGNDEEIGSMIADAIQKVGKDGVIALEEGKSAVTELEITKGMKFEKGYISPYFITNSEKMEVVLENPYILITDKKITLVKEDLLPVLTLVNKTNRPLLIIAEDVEKEALATLVINKLRGIVNVVAVRAPGFGDRKKVLLEDISILTNGQVISGETGLNLETITIEALGKARRATILRDSTTIVEDNNQKAIHARCEQLKNQLLGAKSSYEKENLQERLAKLIGGVAVIKVGAATETEMKEKKLRLEDSINATKAAVEEGIVPGGGAALVHISKNLGQWSEMSLTSDELLGANIIEKASLAPLQKIAENSGQNGSLIVEALRHKNTEIGYDALSNSFVNMYNAGIIDPAKVTRSAVQNAASIASMVLTTECVIVNRDKKHK
nr:chaperonin GroEL [Cyanidiaceae sp.]